MTCAPVARAADADELMEPASLTLIQSASDSAPPFGALRPPTPACRLPTVLPLTDAGADGGAEGGGGSEGGETAGAASGAASGSAGAGVGSTVVHSVHLPG